MHGQQLLQHALQLIQVKRVRSVGLRRRRIVMDLKEDPVNTCGDRSASEHRDELGLSAADAIAR